TRRHDRRAARRLASGRAPAGRQDAVHDLWRRHDAPAGHRRGAGAFGVTLDRTLSALADPHRRRVIGLLAERPRAAGELARAVGLAPPAMSRHLKTLRQSGLVEESHPEFDARVRVYALRAEP